MEPGVLNLRQHPGAYTRSGLEVTLIPDFYNQVVRTYSNILSSTSTTSTSYGSSIAFSLYGKKNKRQDGTTPKQKTKLPHPKMDGEMEK
jgi:hypothetical protein